MQGAIVVVVLSCLSQLCATDARAREHTATRATKTGAAKNGWLFSRNNGLGKEIIYVSNDGVMVKYPDSGLTVVTQEPDWGVAWFNSSSRRIYTETIDGYRKRKGMPTTEKSLMLSRISATTYAGNDAVMYSLPCSSRSDTGAKYLPGVAKDKKRAYLLRTNYYFTKPLRLTTEPLKFLDTFFGVPASGGVPLACHKEYSDKTVERLWTTNSYKAASVPESLFVVPKGYAVVSSQEGLGSYQKMTGPLEDMVRGMGVGEPFGHE